MVVLSEIRRVFNGNIQWQIFRLYEVMSESKFEK